MEAKEVGSEEERGAGDQPGLRARACAHAQCTSRVRCMQGTYGSTDDVKELTYRLKLGDIVRVEGARG